MQEWSLSHEGIITSSQTFLNWIFCVFFCIYLNKVKKKEKKRITIDSQVV